jgi:hypothetical protein
MLPTKPAAAAAVVEKPAEAEGPGISEAATKIQSAVEAFNPATSTFNDAVKLFGSSALALADALKGFPSEVAHTHAPIKVEVNLVQAGFLEGLHPLIKEAAEKAVKANMPNQPPNTRTASGG